MRPFTSVVFGTFFAAGGAGSGAGLSAARMLSSNANSRTASGRRRTRFERTPIQFVLIQFMLVHFLLVQYIETLQVLSRNSGASIPICGGNRKAAGFTASPEQYLR